MKVNIDFRKWGNRTSIFIGIVVLLALSIGLWAWALPANDQQEVHQMPYQVSITPQSPEELEAELRDDPAYRDLTFEEWNEKQEYRAVDHLSDERLEELVEYYPEKIAREAEAYNAIEKPTPEEATSFGETITRLKDKFILCVQEMGYREARIVDREIHHTEYFIDYTNGSDSSEGTRLPSSSTYTADSGTDTDTIVDSELDGATIASGDYLYNVTRSDGDYVDTWDDGSDTIELVGSITGQTTGDTYYLLRAWETVSQYSTTTVRSAGDIAWLRANTTWDYGAGGEATDINFDEDGTVDSWLELRGCSSDEDEDHWGDGSDTKPIIDFNDAAYNVYFATDIYWRMYQIEVTESADTLGGICLYRCDWWLGEELDVHDNDPGGIGLVVRDSAAETINCNFYSNGDYNVSISSTVGYYRGIGCIYDGGAAGTTCGVWWVAASGELIDCSFGETNEHTLADIRISNPGVIVTMRNTTLGSTTPISENYYAYYYRVHSEDDGGVKGAQKSYYRYGIIERDSSVQIDSLDSVKMSPDSDCGLNSPLTIAQNFTYGDYQLWCTANQSYSVNLTTRETSAWSTPLNYQTFYARAYYLNATSSGNRTYVQSTENLSGTSEVDLILDYTPLQTGWVYITVYLCAYESGKSVNVTVKPEWLLPVVIWPMSAWTWRWRERVKVRRTK